MIPILFLLAATTVFGADGSRIVYTKKFPGSTPAYTGITVSRDGSAVYKESENDDQPVNFKLAQPDVDAIFALADKLDHFKKPLESGLKVAFMGEKTLRWESGPEKSEAKFNYSLDEDARALNEWFERICETQLRLFDLERAVRFDKLGVNKAILQFESALDRKRIIGPDRFLPMLDRIAKNDSYLHMARERAASLADAIRKTNGKPE